MRRSIRAWGVVVFVFAAFGCTNTITQPACKLYGWQDVVNPDASYAAARTVTFDSISTVYVNHGGVCVDLRNFDGSGYEARQCVGCW